MVPTFDSFLCPNSFPSRVDIRPFLRHVLSQRRGNNERMEWLTRINPISSVCCVVLAATETQSNNDLYGEVYETHFMQSMLSAHDIELQQQLAGIQGGRTWINRRKNQDSQTWSSQLSPGVSDLNFSTWSTNRISSERVSCMGAVDYLQSLLHICLNF